MKLLIIDDNTRLAERIKHHLGKQYVIDIVHNGAEALGMVRRNDYAVILLDLRLPDMTGTELCLQIRSAKVATPLLVLTAEETMHTRLELFESGADDYLTKPFNIDELRARVAALARRPLPRSSQKTLVYKDLMVDVDQRKVYRAGIAIHLRRKEFDILEYLMTNSGRVMTRDMIMSYAWDETANGWNNTIDVHIKHIRDKIDRPFRSSLIKTAYGLGYRFDASE